jgi:CheY-like chemotaxis protein
VTGARAPRNGRRRGFALDILIVDDDRRLAASCARMLEQAGYVCRQVHDGPGALAEVRREPPALVLLDLLLPKIDGRRVLAEMRRSPELANIPVVVISGVFKDKRVARECQEAGAKGFLEKPFEGDSLLTTVRSLVGTPEAEREEPAADEMRVPLCDVPVSEYTWRTMRSGFSGAIHFQRGKMHKVLLLESGQPKAIRSNAVRETLGERLVQAGRINTRQNDESRQRAKQEGRMQGELLVEMGLITPQLIERCLQEQVEEKLLETFRWIDGEAWVQSGVRAVSYASDLSDWSPEDVVLCGALQMRFDRVMAILTTFAEQRLAPVRKGLPKRAAALPPITSALRAISESKTVGALLADHAAALYGLWLTGFVEFRSEMQQRSHRQPCARRHRRRPGPRLRPQRHPRSDPRLRDRPLRRPLPALPAASLRRLPSVRMRSPPCSRSGRARRSSRSSA